MIKALLIVHICSLMIAAVAWVLQRDNGEQVGQNFPKPKVWLSLILLCFVPGLMSIMPLTAPTGTLQIDVFERLSEQVGGNFVKASPVLNGLTIYICGSVLLMAQTLWRWSRLQRLPLTRTDKPDIYITKSVVPPLTLSWPRRAVVIPEGLQNQAGLIAHECAHLRHKDAEFTLVLLLIRDLMLRNFGISYLVRQWRLSIELRADHVATQIMTPQQRKDYAALLLQGLKPSSQYADGRALPCPTAHLTSTRHRSVKMRLTKIMQNKPNPRKRHWTVALAFTAIGAATLGLATANAATDMSDVTYVKRVPPIMPVNCPELDVNTISIEGKEMTIKGEVTYMHIARVGSVQLKFDVQPNGSTQNIRVTESNNVCFEPNAKAAVSQWIVQTEGKPIKDISVLMQFTLTGEEHEDIEGPLNKFLLGGY